MNTALKQVPISTTNLTVVEKPRMSGDQALAKIHQLLGDKRRTPAHIFDAVLNAKQRTVLCFAAGLSRDDLNKSFTELTTDARLSIQKALVMMGAMYSAFSQHQALELKKFA